jgi:L-ascorbate metabolism protein UlaG (beta-lactamase superfamily)
MPDGTVDAGAFQVSGHPAYHDDAQGRLRGEVRLIMVECGGLRLLHLSDVGHELDAATVAAVGRPDVAFVPAGGVFTWEPEAAWRTIARLSPRVVVPMHYKASGLALPLHDLQWFVGDRPTVSLGRALELDADDLPPATEIWRFDR